MKNENKIGNTSLTTKFKFNNHLRSGNFVMTYFQLTLADINVSVFG